MDGILLVVLIYNIDSILPVAELTLNIITAIVSFPNEREKCLNIHYS